MGELIARALGSSFLRLIQEGSVMTALKSKLSLTAHCLALWVCVSCSVGCGRQQTNSQQSSAAPTQPAISPARIKEIVALLDAKTETEGFVDVKAGAAKTLGDLGQAARDAGAVPALTRLSKSGKATPKSKAAAQAALAKLNAPAAP